MKNVPNMRIADIRGVSGLNCQVVDSLLAIMLLVMFGWISWWSQYSVKEWSGYWLKIYKIEQNHINYSESVKCVAYTLTSLLNASKMKRRATSAAKISLVNLVKNLTKVEPWKPATIIEITKVQIPTQVRHGRKAGWPKFVLQNSNRA